MERLEGPRRIRRSLKSGCEKADSRRFVENFGFSIIARPLGLSRVVECRQLYFPLRRDHVGRVEHDLVL